MDLHQGTLDLFVLRSLTDGARHGYGVAAWLRDASGGHLDIEEGALYHALHRMERRGWLRAEWGSSENGRRACFYRLTPSGKRELARQTDRWERYAAVAARILQPGHGRS